MGCGVSKEDITKPARIQTVVVNVGSPESHLKAHEANLKHNHGVVCLVGTQCNGPSSGINSCDADLDDALSHTVTPVLSDGLQGPLAESPQREENVQREEDHEGLPQQSPPVQHMVQESPLFRSTNGLVGTLAGLDEILGIHEASSLKLAIKVTAEKIMNYGGVLHSLEDQVGGFSYPLECDKDMSIELEHEAKAGPKVLEFTIENDDRMESPTLTSPKPSLERFCKKLPPILTPPSSSVMDDPSITDPFARTPFPTHCQPRAKEIVQDLSDKSQPLSPQLPHTTEMVAVENIKDIIVMSGASCLCEEGHIPSNISLLEGRHQDTDNITPLKNQETGNRNHAEDIMHPNSHNIILSNLIQDFGDNSGVNTFSPLTPFSTCSGRIEYLEEGDIQPISSEEFYS